MTDSPLEFLNENVARRYPFAESAALTSEGGDLSDAVVLDVRGFSRERPEISPRLACIVGPAADVDATYPAVANAYAFYWEMGAADNPVRVCTAIEITDTWPVYSTGVVRDSHFPDRDVRRAVIQAVVGSAVQDIPQNHRLHFVDTAPLENSTVDCLYRAQIDDIRIIHRTGPTEVLSGDVQLRGGYNTAVQASGNTLRILPALGAGELGRFVGSNSPDGSSQCAGRIISINGIGATKRGEFYLRNGPGVEIINYPDLHKIVIKVAPEALSSITCKQ